MEVVSGSWAKNPHFLRRGPVGFEFNSQAVEISLFDSRGRVIWQKRREEPLEVIRWEGLDLRGEPVGVGTYTCKMTYLGMRTVYLPFVFIR